MKKKISVLTIALVVSSVLITSKVVSLSNETPTKNENQTTNKVDTISQTKINGGKKISEVNTTWGEYLDSYVKETNDEDYNPREDLSKDHKVRVIMIEYINGIECKNGFYSYGLIRNIYDEKTDELLDSVGHYTNNIQ